MKRNFVCDIPIFRIDIFNNITTTTYFKKKDLYKILGVHKNSSQQDIKDAYFKKAKIVHPDSIKKSNISDSKGKNDKHQEFIDIKYAYDILKKPDTRKLYDEGFDPVLNQQYKRSNRSKGNNYAHYYNYHNSNNNYKSTFYGENINFRGNPEEIKKRNEEGWRNILIYTSLGIFMIFFYHFSYFMSLKMHEKKLQKLVKRDEIARSYIRQFGEKEKINDKEELEKYGKILFDDIEEVQKRKIEELGNYNPKEIREEWRWFDVLNLLSWSPSISQDKKKID